MENKARKYRLVKKRFFNGVYDEVGSIKYTMSSSDMERNTTYANYPSRDEIGAVSDSDYELKLGQFMDALGIPTEKKLLLMSTATYSESGCAYTCKINAAIAKNITSSSITVEAQELDPTLPSALGYQFSIDGGATWFPGDPATRNTYTFTSLQPDREYTVEARERAYGQCRFSTTVRTAPATYGLFSLDTTNSFKLDEVERIMVGNATYNKPFTNSSIQNVQLLTGTPVTVSVTPTTNSSTNDFGWDSTTDVTILENDVILLTAKATMGTFTTIRHTFTPGAGKVYKLVIN